MKLCASKKRTISNLEILRSKKTQTQLVNFDNQKTIGAI